MKNQYCKVHEQPLKFIDTIMDNSNMLCILCIKESPIGNLENRIIPIAQIELSGKKG